MAIRPSAGTFVNHVGIAPEPIWLQAGRAKRCQQLPAGTVPPAPPPLSRAELAGLGGRLGAGTADLESARVVALDRCTAAGVTPDEVGDAAEDGDRADHDRQGAAGAEAGTAGGAGGGVDDGRGGGGRG